MTGTSAPRNVPPLRLVLTVALRGQGGCTYEEARSQRAPRWLSHPRPTRRAAGRSVTAQPAAAAPRVIGGRVGPHTQLLSAVPPHLNVPTTGELCASPRAPRSRARHRPWLVSCRAPSRGHPALLLAAPESAPRGAPWTRDPVRPVLRPRRHPLSCARPSPTLAEPLVKRVVALLFSSQRFSRVLGTTRVL